MTLPGAVWRCAMLLGAVASSCSPAPVSPGDDAGADLPDSGITTGGNDSGTDAGSDGGQTEDAGLGADGGDGGGSGAIHTVTPTGTQVTISPNGPQSVNDGATQSFEVMANPGHTTSSVVTGTCAAGAWSGSTYTTGPITADCSVTFSATPNIYTVTSSGTQVSIGAVSGTTASHGSTVSFDVSAASGYTRLASVGGTCPMGAWNGGTYTTGSIVADCSVVFYAVNQWATVANNGQSGTFGSLSRFGIDEKTGALIPVGGPVAAPGYPNEVVTTSDGRFVYAAMGTGGVAQYEVVASTGELTPLTPSKVAIATQHLSRPVLDKWIYGTDYSADVIRVFSIDSTSGTLTQLSTIGGISAEPLVASPDGKWLYVVDFTADVLRQYGIDGATGALTPLVPASVSLCDPSNPTWCAGSDVEISPDGLSVYTIDLLDNFRGQYSVAATGQLSAKTPAMLNPGATGGSHELAVSPDGKWLFITWSAPSGHALHRYEIASGGVLTDLVSIPVARRPRGLAFSPNGAWLYVTEFEDGTVSQLAVDPVTGDLTPLSPAYVTAGLRPWTITVR